MAQPEYVPLSPADRVRPVERLPPARRWFQRRPADLVKPGQPRGKLLGTPGPDQGYGAMLAERFSDRLQLAPGEHAEDAIAGCLAVALRRAALFGRAPVIWDLEHAFTLWGYLGDPPPGLVEHRVPLFQSAAHHYEAQRAIADSVAESTLRLTPEQLQGQLSDWRNLLVQ